MKYLYTLSAFVVLSFSACSSNEAKVVDNGPEADTSAAAETGTTDTVKTFDQGTVLNADTPKPKPTPPQVVSAPKSSLDPLPYQPSDLGFEEKIVKPDTSLIYEVVEEAAEFPGGMAALLRFFRNHLVYPEYEKELGVSGKVFVKFMVDANGAISRVQVLKTVPGSVNLSAEAIRLVQAMPRWKPGKLYGRSVKSWVTLPIMFALP